MRADPKKGNRPSHGCSNGCDNSGAGHHGNTVGHDPIADKASLFRGAQGFQVIAVNGDIVGSGQETADKKDQAKEKGGLGERGKSRCDQHKSRKQNLHEEKPLAFGAIPVDMRRPKKL